MNYIKELEKDELKYICGQIPFRGVASYFRKYPKEFAKLRPGFRVKSLNEEDVARILYDFRNTDFISSFLTKTIQQWMEEIAEELEKAIGKGLDQETAYIEILSQSFFAGNVQLYFKIREEERSEDYILVLSAAVCYRSKEKKDDDIELNRIKKQAEEIDKTVEDLIQKISEEEKKSSRLSKRIAELQAELAEQKKLTRAGEEENARLSAEIAEIEEKLKKVEQEDAKKAKEHKLEVATYYARIEEYKKKEEEYERQITVQKECIGGFTEKLALAEKNANEIQAKYEECEGFVSKLREERSVQLLEQEELIKRTNDLAVALEEAKLEVSSLEHDISKYGNSTMYVAPLRPVDMEDFDEYFGYNLVNIGFSMYDDGGKEFVEYIETIAFDGVPLLIKRGLGLNLANCLANTIYGKQTATVFTYSEGIGIGEIEEFLSVTDERVVCLDGFIGNCNEMELISLLDQHRNKIIIVTYMYDRTLRYIPGEILLYVNFLSADEFGVLLKVKDITEDPSELKEEVHIYHNSFSDRRIKKIFTEIVSECGLGTDIAHALADRIENEQHMNDMLLFSILPYVKRVLGDNPYNSSNRLKKYAGESGRCPNKDIILRWFG